MTPEFKNAKLFTGTDGEYIHNTGYAEAVREQLEGDWEDGETTEEQCKRMGPITITAYNPGLISETWLANQVDRMLERFKENFSEEYGCEEYPGEPWTEATATWAKSVILANLRKSLRSAETYNVISVGTHTFSVEECIEMMRE
jgi:hypothetical protein